MVSSSHFCSVCGAANTLQATSCFACGQSLQTTSPSASLDTSLLRQRFRLLDCIGRGGMGAVYRAEDTELGNRLVAIKEISLRGLNQQEAVQATAAFKQEALMLAGLMHPHLPRIYDHFSELGRWYLVMDFIQGETLEEYLVLTGKDPSITPFFFAPLLVGPTELQTLLLSMVAMDASNRPESIAIVKQELSQIEMLARTGQLSAPSQLGATFGPVPVVQTPAIGDLLCTYRGMHIDRISTLVWSPDGTRIASASYDKTVQVWNATTGKLLLLYNGHTNHWIGGRVYSLAWCPDDPALFPHHKNYVASGGDDRTIRIWDAETGETHHLYREHKEAVLALSWATKSSLIASASGKTVRIWNPATGETRASYGGHSDLMQTVAWCPDSIYLAIGGKDALVQVIDTMQPKWNILSGTTYHGHTGLILAIAWSPDRIRLASVSDDSTIQVWNSITGNMIFCYRDAKAAQTVAWSPDGNYLAFGGVDSKIRIINVATQNVVYTYEEHYSTVHTLAWSPDGTRIVSADAHNDVHVWWATSRQ